jgi:hypothetical protein
MRISGPTAAPRTADTNRSTKQARIAEIAMRAIIFCASLSEKGKKQRPVSKVTWTADSNG